MSNGSSSIKEMLVKDWDQLAKLPCEERVEKLEEIIKLYSDLMKDCRLLKASASAKMEVIIYGSDVEEEGNE